MSSIPYYLIFLVPFSVIQGYVAGGVFNFSTVVAVFGVIPLLDLLIGTSSKNPDPETIERIKDEFRFKVITWLCALVQVGIVIWGAFIIASGRLSLFEAFLFTLSMGTSSGVMGINVSHELQHRVNNKLEPLLSRFMLWSVMYMHWAVEHVVGHHRNVATPDDPATARLGESFYAFWPRTVLGGLASSWHIEKQRLIKKGGRAWSVENRFLKYALAELALVVAIRVFLGPAAVFYFLGQSLVAISLLEVVNYIEHYGLLRKQLPNGRFEPVNVTHSWNSSNILTNIYLFNLQRHSHHHASPGSRYQILKHFNESPQLPTGYAGMILLAIVPSLWRKVMDGRVPRKTGSTPSMVTPQSATS
ncbi:MAG: alkane 1-monooxygenase [Desulfobacteraceae bacterium]|nr:alkane 1-monooxygenase [Desulfobacteraceae bacterium]